MGSAGGCSPYDVHHNSPSTSNSFTKMPSATMKVFINGIEVTFEVSPSACASTILYSTKEHLFPHLMIQDDETFLQTFDRTAMSPLGFIDELTVNYELVTISNQRLFIVCDEDSQVIGSEWLSALYVWPPLSQQIDDNNRNLRLPISPVCTPLVISPQVIFNNIEQELKKGINALIRDKVITPLQSSAPTPVEPVAFANGTISSDGDNRFSSSREDYFGRLSVCTIISKLSGNSLFCKLKLDEREYFKNHLDRISRETSTLVQEDGQLLRPYQQLGHTPKVFHKLISRKLYGLDVVIVGDYVCVYGKTLVETAYQLSSVLKVLHNMKIEVNENQSSYFTKSLTVFNVTIDKMVAKELNYNVRPIKLMPRPVNVSLLKSLYSKFNYFVPFLKSMFRYLQPLKKTRFNDEYPWTLACDLSFNIVRKSLLLATSVSHLKDEIKMVINCSSSFHGIAAVLSAIGEGNMRMPVAFCNAKLDEDQIKYTQIEKDAYAITYAFEKFHEFIWGRQFMLEIDNVCLLDLLTAPHGFDAFVNEKLKRWLISFSLYDYHVVPNLTGYHPAEYLARVV